LFDPVSLDPQEKTALYNMSVLWEKMEGMKAQHRIQIWPIGNWNRLLLGNV